MIDIIAAYIRHLKGHTDANSVFTLTGGTMRQGANGPEIATQPRLYAHQSPVKAVRPYVVFVPYPGQILRVFGGLDIEEPQVQIDVVSDYDNNSAPAWNIQNALVAELEYAALDLLTARHLLTRRDAKTPRTDVTENILTISTDWMTSYQLQVPKP